MYLYIFYSSELGGSDRSIPCWCWTTAAGQLKHHSNGVFTNPVRRTAFEFKDGGRHGQRRYPADQMPAL